MNGDIEVFLVVRRHDLRAARHGAIALRDTSLQFVDDGRLRTGSVQQPVTTTSSA